MDYRITITEPTSVFSDLVVGVVPKTYTATELTAGLTYTFTVEARNAYGYSLASDSL